MTVLTGAAAVAPSNPWSFVDIPGTTHIVQVSGNFTMNVTTPGTGTFTPIQVDATLPVVANPIVGPHGGSAVGVSAQAFAGSGVIPLAFLAGISDPTHVVFSTVAFPQQGGTPVTVEVFNCSASFQYLAA